MILVITDKAYRSITKECLTVVETETGGILIGKKIDEHRFIVPFVLGPGLKARKSWIRYTPDVQWQQVRLEKLFRKYAVNYLGSYHSHPGDNNLPSQLDFIAARRITSDPEWNVTEAVFPIITLTDKKINFYPYYFSRASKEFHLINWQIVTHNDPLIKSILKKEDDQ